MLGYANSMYIYNNGIFARSGAAFDTDAQAFITAASITDATQQNAINTLVLNFKSANIWTKMKAIYPFVGGNASSHRFNLKAPTTNASDYYLDFIGGWTHSSSGALPNGTTAYADTKLVPSSIFTTSSMGMGMYLGTLNTSASSDPIHMGVYNTTTQASTLLVNKANTNIVSRMFSGAITSSTVTGTGLVSTQRNSTLVNLYKNSTQVANVSSSGTLPNIKMCLGNVSLGTTFSMYSSGWVNSEFRFAYASDGLSATEISDLYTSIQAFQTTLSRNV